MNNKSDGKMSKMSIENNLNILQNSLEKQNIYPYESFDRVIRRLNRIAFDLNPEYIYKMNEKQKNKMKFVLKNKFVSYYKKLL